MSDDIETLRAEIERLSNRLEWEKRCHKVASEKLVPVESDRDRLQGRVATLQKALDDHFAADKRAAKAIFTATGRKWGFPDNTEVVAFYVAEVERLENELAKLTGALVQKARFEWNDNQMRRIEEENDSLRAKLDRAAEAFEPLVAACEEDFTSDQTETICRDSDYSSVAASSIGQSALTFGHIRKARAVLSELSADAPAQQTQISDEVREAMVEAEKALGSSESYLEFLDSCDEGSDEGPIVLGKVKAALAKLRSVMK